MISKVSQITMLRYHHHHSSDDDCMVGIGCSLFVASWELLHIKTLHDFIKRLYESESKTGLVV